MRTDYRAVTAEMVTAEAETAIARADALIAAAASKGGESTFASTLQALELAGAAVADAYGRSAFLGYVHPDAAVRDAGHGAEELITKWRVGLPFRENLYRAVAAFAATDAAAALDGEQARLLAHWLRDFRRAGQELDAERRGELEQLRGRLVELEVAFSRNLNEARDWIETDRAGLAGMPDAFVERLSPGSKDETYRVTLDYPEITPFLSQAHDRTLREELFRKNWNQAAAENRPLLAEAIGHRRRIAELLDHPTWAHYAMEIKMAGRPERVADFYAGLVPAMEAAAADEVQHLQSRLAQDGYDGPLQAWDWLYYDTVASREQYHVDHDEVTEYLPLDAAMDGMFALTAEVFGLEYRRIEPANAWHESVELFEIRDRASGQPLAEFYTDLFPREGKYGHAAAFPMVVGHRAADGSYVRPVTAIVANFTPPSADRPSLLRHGPHGEIETLFHEFGHVLHMSLTRAEFARFSGAETEWDFVEAPSQIMEHWVWEPEVLGRFARHYRTGDPIPADLVERLVTARYINVGLRATRQIFFGTMDLGLHMSKDIPDLDAVIRDAYAVTQLPYPEDTFMLGSFGHLMGGYDAGYYGYLWAEVIGDDMWSRFATEGVTNPEVGMAYRRSILEPNGSRDADVMVQDFLGRPADIGSYLRLRGLDEGG